jgi:hypothetical protein
LRPPPPWALAVFAAAFAVRLAFCLLVDQPLLYTHQYHYFTSGLRLAEHPSPLREILFSDQWRLWDEQWTIAPLYHLFLAAAFTLFGPHLFPLRVIQSALDALAAVAVGALGRRAAGPRGAWAGIAYALWWPAIEMPSWTMTENVHTVLFVGGVAILAAGEPLSKRRALIGGIVLGLSALARSVSSGFLALAALWRWWAAGRGWTGVRAAAPIVFGGALVVLPWTARNVFLSGDPVFIESAAFENIWYANNFVDGARLARQKAVIDAEPTPADRRRVALLFAARGITRYPGRFVEKVEVNFWHFFRPEGLHSLVRVQRSLEPWRHAGSVVLDDLLVALIVPLTCVFLLAGRPSPARVLIAAWMAYYLLMVVVIFHNEVRYRSAFIPFACAAAAGGIATLADRERRRGVRTWVGLALGLTVAVGSLRPYAADGRRDLAATWAMRRAERAVADGATPDAWRITEEAAAQAPRSARPWFDLAKALHFGGDLVGAAAAYRKGEPRAVFVNWRGLLGLARLLPAVEEGDEAARKLRQVDAASWDADPWLVQETAWRELPPPRTDEVRMARNDYGAVRGFFHPRGLEPPLGRHRREWTRYEETGGPEPPPGPHRWSRSRSWIRLAPARPASAYEVTIEMGSPFPSLLESPEVTVRGNDGVAHRATLTADVRPHVFRVGVPEGEPLLLRLDSPVWSRPGEPADQGVRVDRVYVKPAP